MKMIGGKRFTVPHSVWGNLSSRDSRSAAAFDAVNNVYAASQQQDYEDKERDRNRAINVEDRQWALTEEMLRARIDRMRQPMPDFYGSGPTYSGATGWDNILREAFAKRGGGMDRRGGGGMNALAQILGGA